MTEFNFDNNKKPNELNELKTNAQPSAPSNDEKLIGNTKEDKKDNEQIEPKQTKAEQQKAGNVLVTYIGHGVWVDANHEHWSKDAKENVGILTDRTYTKEEYEKRADIKFMVDYGEMKAIDV